MSVNDEETAHLVAPTSAGLACSPAKDKIVTSPSNDTKLNQSYQHKFRGDIEAFCGFAVFCVVMYHLYPDSSAGTGVDIFFVLSGFCITSMLRAWTEHNFFSPFLLFLPI